MASHLVFKTRCCSFSNSTSPSGVDWAAGLGGPGTWKRDEGQGLLRDWVGAFSAQLQPAHVERWVVSVLAQSGRHLVISPSSAPLATQGRGSWANFLGKHPRVPSLFLGLVKSTVSLEMLLDIWLVKPHCLKLSKEGPGDSKPKNCSLKMCNEGLGETVNSYFKKVLLR